MLTPRAPAPREYMLGPGFFLLIMPNKSTCLPEEHKRLVSTCWGLDFFVNHTKKERMATRKVNAYP